MRTAAAYLRSGGRLQQAVTVSRFVNGPVNRSSSRLHSSPLRPHKSAVEVVSADNDAGFQHSSSGRVVVLHKRRPASKDFGSSSKRAADEEGRSSSGGGSEEKRRRCGDTDSSGKERSKNPCFKRGGVRQPEDAPTSNDTFSRIATITLSDDDGEGDIFPKVMAPRRSNSLCYEYDATQNESGTKMIKAYKFCPRQKSVGSKCRRNLKTEIGNLSNCPSTRGNDYLDQMLHPAQENDKSTAHRAGLLSQGSGRSKSSSDRSFYDVALCARKLYDRSVICRVVADKFTPGNPRLEAFLRHKLKEDEPSWSMESQELEEGGRSCAQLEGSDGWPPRRMVPFVKDSYAQSIFREDDTDLNNNRVRQDGTKNEIEDKSLSLMTLSIQSGHSSNEMLEVEHLEQLQLASPVDCLERKEATRKSCQKSPTGERRECNKSCDDSGTRCHRKPPSRAVTLSLHQPAGKQTSDAGRRPVLQVLPYNVEVEEQDSDDCPSSFLDHLRQTEQRSQTLAGASSEGAFELPRPLPRPTSAKLQRLNSIVNGHCPDCNVEHDTSAFLLNIACKKRKSIDIRQRSTYATHRLQMVHNVKGLANGDELIFDRKTSVAAQHNESNMGCKHRAVTSKTEPSSETKNTKLIHSSSVAARDGSATASAQAAGTDELFSRGGRKTRERRCKRKLHKQEGGVQCSSMGACLRQLLPVSEPLKKVKHRQSRRIVPKNEDDTVAVTWEDTECFLNLIERDVIIAEFLHRDVCRLYADRFLLAVVFVYFMRAGLGHQHYDRLHFFGALYLAHDLEEDDENMKRELLLWLVTDESLRELLLTASVDPPLQQPSGAASQPRTPSEGQPREPSGGKPLTRDGISRLRKRCCGSRHSRSNMRWLRSIVLITRDKLFWAMNCRAIVSRSSCLKVMSFHPEHSAWQRERPDYHANIVRECRRGAVRRGRLYKRPSEDLPSGCHLCLERQQWSCVMPPFHLGSAGPLAPGTRHKSFRPNENQKLMKVEMQSVFSHAGGALNHDGHKVIEEQRGADPEADVVMADNSNDEYHDTSGVSCHNTSSGKEGKDSGYESVLVYSADCDSNGCRAARPHLLTSVARGTVAEGDSGARASAAVAGSDPEPRPVTAAHDCRPPRSPSPACFVVVSRGRCRRSSARRARRVTAANIRDSLFIRPRSLLPLLDQLYHSEWMEESGCMAVGGGMDCSSGRLHDAALNDLEEYYTRGKNFPWQFANNERKREIRMGVNDADENGTTIPRMLFEKKSTLETTLAKLNGENYDNDPFADASEEAGELFEGFKMNCQHNTKPTGIKAVLSQAGDSSDEGGEHWSQAETVILAGSGQ